MLALLPVLRTATLVLNPFHVWKNLRNLWLWTRVVRNTKALRVWTKYFDSSYYLEAYPDVEEKGLDPSLHFLLCGNAERRQPSALFSTDEYLDRYPDVRKSGLNALLHYAMFGYIEARIAPGPRGAPYANPVGPLSESEDPHAVVINNDWPDDRPLVSILISCCACEEHLRDALRSLVKQTFVDVEIVIVTDCSTDRDTFEQSRGLEAECLPRVTFYRREGRHSPTDNQNYGVTQARGRYIYCLDGNDMLRPTFCEVAVFLAEGYGYDVVYSSIECFGDSGFRSLATDEIFPGIAGRNQIATSALFRKADWVHAGGFREGPTDDSHVPEVWEFWVRLITYGCRLKSIREPLLLYRVDENTVTSGSDTDPERQRPDIEGHTTSLSADCRSSRDVKVQLFSRWSNFDKGDGDPRLGFLLALPFATIGGAETLLYGLAQEVARRGFRLMVTTSRNLPETFPDTIKSFTVLTPHIYPLAQLFDDPGVAEEFVCRLVKRHRVSHLFFAGCELVYHLLPRLREEFPSLTILDQVFNDEVHAPNNRRYRAYIDATIVPSEALKASLLRQTPDCPGRIHVIPHSVEIPAPESRTMRQLRETLSLPPQKLIVAFFGRLSREKGADVFVEIARTLAPRGDLFFLMTGEGPERSRILRLIQKYGLDSTIQAPGFVEDVRPLMAASDIVVVPSTLDGMPLVVFESQALGKAVVASSVGSIPSMISDAVTGFLCPPGDVRAFVSRIEQLADDLSLRLALGRAAQALVRECFNKERMLRSYFEVLEDPRPKNGEDCRVSSLR
jgi:glycosyltransferase involved in cell wall biosynthesis